MLLGEVEGSTQVGDAPVSLVIERPIHVRPINRLLHERGRDFGAGAQETVLKAESAH
ncbi:hypothetical protein SDC9_166534 [bioreactor metagenome]|uniref:Uncharacterized protein n=1 Tax=bioreactor metagenome TaxID=1076179 RepID=A0A645FXB1_9ZZZZ